MKAQKAFITALLFVFLLIITIPVAGKTNDSIIVNNADTVRQETVSKNQSLLDLFDVVESRIVVQYANTLRQKRLSEIPGALGVLFSQVSDRIIIQYANNNRQEKLSYPETFFNDTTAPQISGLTTQSCIIKWTTDEFANSTVVYGTTSGQYPQSVNNELYTKYHEIVFSGVVPGTTYYLKVSSTDRSGNTATSSEHSCTALNFIFLPLTVSED